MVTDSLRLSDWCRGLGLEGLVSVPDWCSRLGLGQDQTFGLRLKARISVSTSIWRPKLRSWLWSQEFFSESQSGEFNVCLKGFVSFNITGNFVETQDKKTAMAYRRWLPGEEGHTVICTKYLHRNWSNSAIVKGLWY